MQRITERHLQAIVNRLNEITSSPMEPYTRDADERFVANVGNFHLDYAYGKVKLVRMGNESGGITSLTGFGTKRETYNAIHAFMDGYVSALTDVKSN